MRAIIIDAEKRSVSEADIDGGLQSLQQIIGGLIDPVYPGLEGTDHHCYVNDEGLLNNPQNFFMLKDGHQPLAGNGVILSTTPEGDEAPATLPLHWVKERVTFMDLQAVREWVAHERNQEVLASLIDADLEAEWQREKEAPLKHAKAQGQAQYDSIRELVARLSVEEESAREAIMQDPLSVLVRPGWHEPGLEAGAAEEFEILLCTGGPAVRLVGHLDNNGDPGGVRMQVQDWFQPWTDFEPADGEASDVLQTYAECFYFGEGRVREPIIDAKAAKKEALAQARAETEESIARGQEHGKGNSRE